jgi:serine protease Do
MIRREFFSLAALAALTLTGRADTLVLRDNSSLTGRILAEKPEQIVLDVGYTVLLVPRNEVVKINRPEPPATAPKSAAGATRNKNATAPALQKGFYVTATQPLPDQSVRELVNLLGQSVVQVRTPGGLGSGFFINEEGYLITNFHVIEGETKISIEVYHQQKGQLERKSYKDVRIIAMNKFADLALLKVEDADAPKFAPVPLGSADALAVGERVFAIGSPLGLERTVTEGIVSTKTRQMQGALYLQTTAQINPGNSGGPLFNLRGEVVGVTNMKITFGEGLGFAIPVEQLKYFLDHRDAFAYDTDNPSNPYRYLAPPSRLKESETAAAATGGNRRTASPRANAPGK